MTWQQMSQESLLSARRLYELKLLRSSVNRSYYSIFAAITGRLPRGAVEPPMTSPRHRDLPRLVDEHFDWLKWHQREAVKAAIRRTYSARLAADYNVASNVDAKLAKQSLQDGMGVLRRMGVKYAV